MNCSPIKSPRVDTPTELLSLASASRPDEEMTHPGAFSPSEKFRVYGAVQSAGDEREAELLDIAVLGYN